MHVELEKEEVKYTLEQSQQGRVLARSQTRKGERSFMVKVLPPAHPVVPQLNSSPTHVFPPPLPHQLHPPLFLSLLVFIHLPLVPLQSPNLSA